MPRKDDDATKFLRARGFAWNGASKAEHAQKTGDRRAAYAALHERGYMAPGAEPAIGKCRACKRKVTVAALESGRHARKCRKGSRKRGTSTTSKDHNARLYEMALAYVREKGETREFGLNAWTELAVCVAAAAGDTFPRPPKYGRAVGYLRQFDFERGAPQRPAAGPQTPPVPMPPPPPPAVEAGSACRECGAAISWRRTPKGKWQPLDRESGEPHFATCPMARKKRRGAAPAAAKFTRVTNPSGFTSFYSGLRPPWEFSTFIECYEQGKQLDEGVA